MNGKTHQISGVTAVLATTALAIEAHSWILRKVPDWLVPWFSPPPTLLAAAHLLSVTEARVALSNGTLPAAIAASAPTPTPALSLSGMEATLSSLAHYAVDTTTVIGTLLVIALLGLIVGQLPDLDTPYSTISNGGEALAHLVKGKGLFRVLIRFIFDVINVIPHLLSLFANHFMGGHRNGIVHGLVGWLGFSALFGWFAAAVLHLPFYGLLFLVAYFTHLVVDSFSHSGVKWFWPLSHQSHHLLPKGLCFYTANPIHNALAQISSVLLADGALYNLVTYLSRGDQATSTSMTLSTEPEPASSSLATALSKSPTPGGLELGLYGLIIVVSGVIILSIIGAAIAGWHQFKYEEQRQLYQDQQQQNPYHHHIH